MKKGRRRGEEKVGQLSLTRFNARRRGCSTAAAVAQQFQNA